VPLEILLPLVVAGNVLMLGFFFVRGANRYVIFTRFGTHLRAANPVTYWVWTIYYYSSLVFNFVLIIAVIIGLSAG
jgi:hypothetical protein